MKIGYKIMLLRKELGFSQLKLAKRAFLTPSAICYYEKGLRTPIVKALKSISRALCVNINEILYDQYHLYSEDENDDDDEMELIQTQINSLSPKNKLN